MQFRTKLAIPLLAMIALQGCAAVAVIGIAGTASVINDRRTVGAQIDDQTIEAKSAVRIADSDILSKETHLQITSVNGTVLVVGQAPTPGLKKQALNLIKDIDGVVLLHDQVKIKPPISLATRSKDVWLTSKIKANLIASDKVDGTAIKVVTEDSEVFLMGLVTTKEAAVAVDIARNISGVAKVLKAFEYKK